MADLQRTCMDDALERAREEGCEWLLSLDADEFAFAENETRGDTATPALAAGNLPRLLAGIHPATEMVRLQTAELVSCYLGEGQPFWKQTYFQGRQALTREIADPVTGEIELWNDFIADRQGKSIIRTSARVQAFDSHCWVREQGKRYPKQPACLPVPTESRGCRYHFLVTDCDHFKSKYRKLSWEPDVWAGGTPVELPKRCWKRASVMLDEAETRQYLLRHFFLPEPVLEGYVKEKVLRRDETVARVLAESGYFDRADPDRRKWPEARVCPGTGVSTISFVFAAVDLNRALAAQAEVYYDAADWTDGSFTGFYGVELYEGQYFRWASPEAQISLSLVPGDYRLALELGPLCAPERKEDMRLTFNHAPIPAEQVRLEGTRLTFEVCAAQCQVAEDPLIGLSCSALNTSTWEFQDPRHLGVPIFGIHLARLPDADTKESGPRR